MKEFSTETKKKKKIFVCASAHTHFLTNSYSKAFLQQNSKADSRLMTKQTVLMLLNNTVLSCLPTGQGVFQAPPSRVGTRE